jgi:WD40 repeat protein
LTETSFQGCYAGNRFEIPHWSGDPQIGTRTPVPGDESLAREDVAFPGCEAVTAENQYCVTTTSGVVALLGLDSGEVCPLASTSAGVGYPLATSIAWRGEIMYACTGAGLVRISLRDGAWEAAQLSCGGVAEYDGGLLLSGSITDSSSWLSPLRGYPDYEAVLNEEVDRTFNAGIGATVFTVDGDTFYSAWHSTDTINLADLSTDAPRGSIPLDGYDGWILGMSVTGGQLVISGDVWGDTVRIFDAQTGEHLRDVRPSMPVYGLSCVTRQAAL